MVLVNGLPQSGPHHMSINLGSGYVGVAQHGLQAAQVRPTFE